VAVYPTGLPYTSEPVQIKEKIRRIWSAMCSGGNDVDCDRMVVWSNNELSKYLWSKWSVELRRRGYDWQRFLKVLNLATGDIVLWALKNALSWEELYGKISRLLEVYGGGV